MLALYPVGRLRSLPRFFFNTASAVTEFDHQRDGGGCNLTRYELMFPTAGRLCSRV
jgi:hypothetical protein